MKYLSVCSGIEAASVAWQPLGWRASAFSEIDAFPCAVLAHHYPDVPNFGDMTKFKEWPDADVDVLVGGTPCQSFSVAGLRKGLADPRGNLTLTYLAIADRYRPEWVVWENVPGVLSSNGGRDFGTFLGGLGELGYGFAYRVLDAQFCGVPQRRRRVFVVGCVGDWRRAAAVLFERHSLQGHPAPSREAGEGIAPCLEAGANRTGGNRFPGTSVDTVECLIPERERALTASNQRMDAETETLIVGALPAMGTPNGHGFAGFACNQSVDAGHIVTHSLRADGFDASEDGTGRGTPLTVAFAQNQLGEVRCGDVANTVNTNSNASGRNTPMIAFESPPTFLHVNKGRPDGRKSAHTEMVTLETETIPTLATDGHAQSAIAFSCKDSGADADALAPTLRAMGCMGSDPIYADGLAMPQTTRNGDPGVVAFGLRSDAARDGSARTPSADAEGRIRLRDPGFNVYAETAPTIDAGQAHSVATAMQVRRLTPRECERLQGFPDDYTLIQMRGKPAADGPRYKALGNSMATPVVRWIGERIDAVSAIRCAA